VAPLIIVGFGGVDLVWRVLAWVAWSAVSSSLIVVALLAWARSSLDSEGTTLAVVRSIARAFLAGLGVAGAGLGLWILERVSADAIAGRGALTMSGSAILVGISMLWTGIRMTLLPYKRSHT
jgi:hypothetical protein